MLPADSSLQPAESRNGPEDGFQESSFDPIEKVLKYLGTYQSRGYCSCTTSHGSDNVKPKMEMSIWVETDIDKLTNGEKKINIICSSTLAMIIRVKLLKTMKERFIQR